jgi:hypothetical protein
MREAGLGVATGVLNDLRELVDTPGKTSLRPEWQVVTFEMACRSARALMRRRSCSWREGVVWALGLGLRHDVVAATVIWRRVVVHPIPRRSPEQRLSYSPAVVGWLSPGRDGGCEFRWRLSRGLTDAVIPIALGALSALFFVGGVVSGAHQMLIMAVLAVFVAFVLGHGRWTSEVDTIEHDLLIRWVTDVEAELTGPPRSGHRAGDIRAL